jgi:hypothetical protein
MLSPKANGGAALQTCISWCLAFPALGTFFAIFDISRLALDENLTRAEVVMAKTAHPSALAASSLPSTSNSAPPQPGTTSAQTAVSTSGPTSVPSHSATAVPQTHSGLSPASASVTSQMASQQTFTSPPARTTPMVSTTATHRRAKWTVEWTNVAIATAALIFAGYSAYGTFIAISSARKTAIHEHKEECFSYFDHNLPMSRDCPAGLNMSHVSISYCETFRDYDPTTTTIMDGGALRTMLIFLTIAIGLEIADTVFRSIRPALKKKRDNTTSSTPAAASPRNLLRKALVYSWVWVPIAAVTLSVYRTGFDSPYAK